MSLEPIDIATLALCRALIQILLSGLLLFSIRYDRDVSGPGFWAAGFALNGLALVPFFLQLPTLIGLHNVINHVATGLGCCALLLGFWRFNQQKPLYGLLLLIGGLPVLGLVLNGDPASNSTERVLVTASAQLLFYLGLLNLLRRPYRAEIGLVFRWLQILVGLYLLAFLWQFSHIVMRLADYSEASPGELYPALYSIAALLFTLTLAVACIGLQLVRISANYADSAITDWLTGLLNRRGLSLLAEQDDARRRREHGSSAVICFDIDHFKQVNDRFGHPAGDRVLKMLGEVIRANVRGQDIAARQGGEEFSAVLVGGDEQQAFQVAERIRQQFSARSLQLGLGLSEKLTLSAGVDGVGSERTVLQALDAADVALYAAKRAGRNRVMSAADVAASTAPLNSGA